MGVQEDIFQSSPAGFKSVSAGVVDCRGSDAGFASDGKTSVSKALRGLIKAFKSL